MHTAGFDFPDQALAAIDGPEDDVKVQETFDCTNSIDIETVATIILITLGEVLSRDSQGFIVYEWSPSSILSQRQSHTAK